MIELDMSPSVPAPIDTASDDSFISLEMDAPTPRDASHDSAEGFAAALPSVTTEVTAEAPSAPSDAFTTLADMLSATATPVTGDAGAFGSIRTSGYIEPTTRGGTFDASPLTPAEIAERDANRAARAARQAERAARASMPGTSPSASADDTVILPALAAATVTPTERTCGLKLAWNPAYRTGFTLPRAYLVDVLTSAGLADLAPGIPAEKGQFGKIMKSFNSMDARDQRGEIDRLMARCVTRRDYERLGMPWPTDLESRYVVGHVDASPDLGKLGDKFLVCSLVEVAPGEYEVQFTGGTDRLRNAVSEKFGTMVATASMNSTNLLRWYTDTLARKFGAIRCGYAMLIVDKGDDASKAKIERAELLASTLQGADLYGPSVIMGRQLVTERVISREGVTWHSFCIQLGGGMLNDVREHGKLFEKAYADAQELARKQESGRHDATPETIEMAVRRAQIGSDRANNKALALLNTLKALQARAVALVEVIGREHARPAIDACEALRVEWAPKCKGIDATSEMAANIELD